MEKNVIVFAGGGTLGHIYPAIPVIKLIKEENRNIKIVFIASINGIEKNVLEKNDLIDEVILLDVIGINRKRILKNIVVLRKAIKSINKIKKILINLSPNVVIGLGGYIGGIVSKVSVNLKIKTIIHEQNSVFGFSNKLLQKKVNKVLLTYPIDEKICKKNTHKYFIVGNPRTTEYYESYYKIDKSINKDRLVLVVGGSRGAERINETIFNLKDRFLENNIKVIIITGKKYYNENKEKIKSISNNYTNMLVLDFVNNLNEYLLKALVVVSRSGSTTLSELGGLSKATILIPSPNVTKNHQMKNALYYYKQDACCLIDEADLSEEKLFDNIMDLLNNPFKRENIENNIQKVSILNASYLFFNEIKG